MKKLIIILLLVSGRLFAQNALITVIQNTAVINYNGVSNTTISGLTIQGANTACITLTSCHDIHITLNRFINSRHEGIYLYGCYNITIDYNFFQNVSTGVNAVQCPSGSIIITNDQFRNVNGPFPQGQGVQFNNVGGANNSISNNVFENKLGQSYPEDVISCYQSSGTSGSPILINNNKMRGGGPSSSGGGIMLGDSGGSYITASGNIMVNPGQYGAAISGGTFITLSNNIIYGAQQSFTNVGLYVMNIGGYVQANNTVSGNRVNFFNSAGTSNPNYLDGSTATPTGWSSTNTWADATVTSAILATTIITYN